MNVRLCFTIVVLLGVSVVKLSSQSRCLSVPSEVDGRNTRALLDDTLLSIPIVIHNLYRTDAQMISEEQVQEQLRVLNDDFQRRNGDTIDTPSIFRIMAANCEIQFCLAERDPQGNAISGVQNIRTDRFEIGLTEDYCKNFEGGATIWNPAKYLNIWVCEISASGGIAGFAIAPDSTISNREGIVIDYRFFGTGGTAEAPFDGGRTLTHEMGHWMGLNHIWGDTATCSVDDGISDTPLQFDHYDGCPEHPKLSCGSEDMFMNFMDLTNDDCMNLFTQQQKEVMRNNVMRLRPQLLQADVCKTTSSVFQTKRMWKLNHYPNPVEGRLFWTPKNEILLLRVFNIHGVLIVERRATDFLDIINLMPGFYLVTGSSASDIYYGSFVKN